MAAPFDNLLEEALQLPTKVMRFLAERLLESLDVMPGAPLSPAWRDKIQRRVSEVEAGAVDLLSADEVFAAAYKTLE